MDAIDDAATPKRQQNHSSQCQGREADPDNHIEGHKCLLYIWMDANSWRTSLIWAEMAFLNGRYNSRLLAGVLEIHFAILAHQIHPV